MRAALIAVWPIMMAVCLHAAGLNAFLTHSVLEVTGFGYTNIVVGLVATAFYAGLLVGSVTAFRLIGQVGHVRVFSAAAGMITIAVLIGPFMIEPYLWAMVRFVVGAGAAAMSICVESWLNERADNSNRGQVMGLYQIVFYACGIVGNLIVGIEDNTQHVVMMIVAMLYAGALIPVALANVPSPSIPETTGGLSLWRLYRISPLGFIGVFASGVTLGMLFGAGPLYATLNGLNVDQTTYFMSAMIAGALIFIWPVGKLSDLFDRRSVLFGVCVATIAAGIAMVSIPSFFWWRFLAASCVFGGLLTALYPLALSYVNDRMESSDLSAAATAIMLVYGIGAIFGPTVASASITVFGEDGYIYAINATLAGLALFALWRMTRRDAPTTEESGEYVVLPTSSALAFEGYDESEADQGTEADAIIEQTWTDAVAEQQEAWRDEAETDGERLA